MILFVHLSYKKINQHIYMLCVVVVAKSYMHEDTAFTDSLCPQTVQCGVLVHVSGWDVSVLFSSYTIVAKHKANRETRMHEHTICVRQCLYFLKQLCQEYKMGWVFFLVTANFLRRLGSQHRYRSRDSVSVNFIVNKMVIIYSINSQ